MTMEELRDRDELVVELAAQFRTFLARSVFLTRSEYQNREHGFGK